MDNKKTKLILSYFQFCGISHLTSLVDFSKKKLTQFLIIWSFFHLFILSTIVLFLFIYSTHITVKRDTVGVFSIIMQFVLPVLSQYIIIIESLRTRYIKYRFWIRISHMDTFLLYTSSHMKQISIDNFLIKSIVILATTIAIDLFVVFRVRSDILWRNDIIISFYTWIVCRSEVLFCVFFIDTLRYRVDMITIRLKELTYSHKNRLNLLRCCKKSYQMLWLSLQDLNYAFGKFYSVSKSI